MNGDQIMTSCKSYLEFVTQGTLSQLYAISRIEEGRARFVFDLPEKCERVQWIVTTDFEAEVEDVNCTWNGQPVKIERNYAQDDNGKCAYNLFRLLQKEK